LVPCQGRSVQEGIGEILYYVLILQEECIWPFLEERTALDPRFKSRVAAADALWDRVEK